MIKIKTKNQGERKDREHKAIITSKQAIDNAKEILNNKPPYVRTKKDAPEDEARYRKTN